MTVTQKILATEIAAIRLPDDEEIHVKVAGNYYLLSKTAYIDVLNIISRDTREQHNKNTEQTLHYDPVAESVDDT